MSSWRSQCFLSFKINLKYLIPLKNNNYILHETLSVENQEKVPWISQCYILSLVHVKAGAGSCSKSVVTSNSAKGKWSTQTGLFLCSIYCYIFFKLSFFYQTSCNKRQAPFNDIIHLETERNDEVTLTRKERTGWKHSYGEQKQTCNT